MIAFMRDLYYGTMYGGWRGRQNALNYVGVSVFNAALDEGQLGLGWFDMVRLDMDAIGGDFSEFAKTIFHEGCHVGAEAAAFEHDIQDVGSFYGINLIRKNMDAENFAHQLYYRSYGYRWWFNY